MGGNFLLIYVELGGSPFESEGLFGLPVFVDPVGEMF